MVEGGLQVIEDYTFSELALVPSESCEEAGEREQRRQCSVLY